MSSQLWAQQSQADVEQDLQSLESQIDQTRQRATDLNETADVLAEAESDLKGRMVQTAKRAQSLEQTLSDSEQRLSDLRVEETQKRSDLALRQDELEATIAALQRLSRRPPQALLLSPGDTHDAIRAALLLRSTVPVLEQRAKSLERDLTALARIRDTIQQELAVLKNTQGALSTERAALADLRAIAAARRQFAEKESARQTQQLASLSDQAEGLKELLERLEDLRLDQLRQSVPLPPQRSAQKSTVRPQPKQDTLVLKPLEQGNLSLPAAGPYKVTYGQSGVSGPQSNGLTIQTRTQATVTAPAEGRVAFADVFRNYGLLLILEHADGYHTLMSGMASLDTVVGQWVVTGEPIGHMGEDADDIKLYVELRSNGKPVNPLPWFAALNNGVSG